MELIFATGNSNKIAEAQAKRQSTFGKNTEKVVFRTIRDLK